MKGLAALLKKGAMFTFGAGTLWLVNNLFDWILYPAVIYLAGNLTGALIMTLLSVPFNYALIKGYDLIGRDLFALEKAKEIKVQTKFAFVNRLAEKSQWFTFVMLCLWDPIPAVIYMRKRENAYNGLTKKDWCHFAIATLIANGVWIAMIILGLETIGSFF